MRELAPKAHMIRSVISNHWSVHAAVAEFVDNAFAPNKGGAEAIYLDFYRDKILIWDHGRGLDDINRLFQLGNTSSWEDRTDIGLYGVGATHAAIWLGRRLRVATVRNGRLHEHAVDWDECIDKERWPARYQGDGTPIERAHLPKQLLINQQAASGSLIEISRRRGGRNFQMDALMERLGFTFSPGLEVGKKILVRRGGDWKRAKPFSPPQLTEEIRFESEVAGMSYKCRAGLMVPTMLRYNGFFYGFTHRILEKTRDPFREGDSSLLHAQVQLSADWRTCIADHKQAVVSYRDELAADLYRHCKELIDIGREYEDELHVEGLEMELQSLIDQMVAGRSDSGAEATRLVDREPKSESSISVSAESGEGKDDDESVERSGRGHPLGVRFRFDVIPVIALCVEDGGQLLVKLNRRDPEVMRAMENPVNSWGLVTHVMAAVTAHLQARYLQEGEAALRRYMPGVARKIKPGMGPNEVAAEIMTALMRAYPGRGDSHEPLQNAA